MSASILVTYATRYGSTKEVAETIAADLREHGLEIVIQPLRQVRSLEGYRAVVMGAAFYIFHWHKDARHFLSKHRKELATRPVAIFALGPLPNTDEKGSAQVQFTKVLAKHPWLTPVAAEMFGGKLDPARMHFPYNRMPAGDARDWQAIHRWAHSVAEKLQPVVEPSSASV